MISFHHSYQQKKKKRFLNSQPGLVAQWLGIDYTGNKLS